MKEISQKWRVSNRVIFMLRDVIDLWLGEGLPRRNCSNAKTTNQIQMEAERS
jgi:hypothetical protein